MLFTGNFAYALTFEKCEMECCGEKSCCDDGTEETSGNNAVKITSVEDTCCEVYIEQAVEPDHATLIVTKTTNNPNSEAVKIGITVHVDHQQDYTRAITHKFRTSNIYLSVSNLRI